MRKLSILYITIILCTISSCSQKESKGSDSLLFIKGGTFKHKKSDYGKDLSVPDFYLGKYEVTQKEWVEIMGFNPAKVEGDSLPVSNVSWYDCVEYCNKLSEKHGLKTCYTINEDKKDPQNNSKYDEIKWLVIINKNADGYRLPTETEWEYAASGGQLSKNYNYIGSNNVHEVAWFYENSGDKPLSGMWNMPAVEANHNRTHPVGLKQANELGLYDMPGNVREWCWDWHPFNGVKDLEARGFRGGCWMAVELCAEPFFRDGGTPNFKNPDVGFRIAKSKEF